MPIELWWWVDALLPTGLVTFLVFGTAAAVTDRLKVDSKIIQFALWALAIAPWIICAFCFAVWLIANILILTWRR